MSTARNLHRPIYVVEPAYPTPPPTQESQDSNVAWTTASHVFKKNWMYRKGFHLKHAEIPRYWDLPTHIRDAWNADNKED